uniref:Peptidase S1 domain-containing protein n=1 Tax=Steinernema glaseri TaxID=37863 RepID=A0A1I7Z1C2_9BILA
MKLALLVSTLAVVCISVPLSGGPAQLIFGGEPAKLGQFPFFAYYEYEVFMAHSRSACGGVLISPRYILTAAHCTRNMLIPARAFFGLVDKMQGKAASVQRVEIADFHTTSTNPRGMEPHDDIAILELEEPVELNDYVQTIKVLHDDEQLLKGGKATIVGFGQSYFNEEGRAKSGTKLLETQIPIVDHEYCADAWLKYSTKTNETAPVVINENQICCGAEGKGIGAGDSGGPMLVQVNGEWVVVGVASFGTHDLKDQQHVVPAIFNRVSPYCDFIANATKNSVKCVHHP